MNNNQTLLMLGAFVLYFLPSLVAKIRHAKNYGPIVVVNLFLGWTFIGWVVALAMACGQTTPQPPRRPWSWRKDLIGDFEKEFGRGSRRDSSWDISKPDDEPEHWT
jgi:Superinfection immunity protein